MSIRFKILGDPGRDNALLVSVDSGQSLTKLLFDCGEGCLSSLSVSEIKSIDHILFSHLHMDHICGFDTFFRVTFNRESKENHIWGPTETVRIMQHRFRGFMWNLADEISGKWMVHDIDEKKVETKRFEASEAFSECHDEGAKEHDGTIITHPDYSVEAILLDHRTPSVGYIVREKPKHNIDVSRLKKLGLQPGPWIKAVKDTSYEEKNVNIDNKNYDIRELRKSLTVESPGDSIAYLTDFILNKDSFKKLIKRLSGVDTVICEAMYRNSDLEAARKNYHTTSRQSARLAKEAGIGRLILCHISEKYGEQERREMLEESREIFPETSMAWDRK